MAATDLPKLEGPSMIEAAAREGFEVWCCACNAWNAYLAALAGAAGPAGVMDANNRLLAESLELSSRAAALALRSGGVSTPLLSDS